MIKLSKLILIIIYSLILSFQYKDFIKNTFIKLEITIIDLIILNLNLILY